MKLILSHPTGNNNVRAMAETLAHQKVLGRFYTSIAIFPDSFWQFLYFSNSPFKVLTRRSYNTVLQNYTQQYPWIELGRLISGKLNMDNLIRHEEGIFCIDKVYKSLGTYVASKLSEEKKKGATAVYAYEDGALEIFSRAKESGMTCVYELPIAYWETGRKLLKEEAQRLPQWERTLGGGIIDSEVKLARKTKELELADIVVVPGNFVMNSLPEWANGKNKILSPFGSPNSPVEQAEGAKKKRIKKPLRVLFVGSMGQRKGLADLFTAMQMLDRRDIELVVLGPPLDSMDFYKQQYPFFVYETVRENNKVLELMRTCDVFCLPSIVEGRALVMQEAMSQGLPLIITPNTGGEDLIKEGQTGFLVPIRCPEAIAEKLQWFLENRREIPRMGVQAQALAATYSWEHYGKKIVQEVRDFVEKN